MPLSVKRSDFPPDFNFGVATSSYQIEGHDYGGAGPTHWDTFAATPNNVVRRENGAIACDHYHRWEEDLDLIAAAGMDSYRFSTSWARILPEGRGPVNLEGLDFYDRLVDGMLERKINPCATLYHWELPSALADLGGWQNPDIANWFADFTHVVMKRIGDRVDSVAPINEPWCVAWLSHFEGAHAPGLRDIRAAAHAMHHVLLAHSKSIAVMRDLGVKNLGAIVNLEYAEPADSSPEAQAATKMFDGIFNRWFLGGLFHQAYPDDVLVELAPHMPKGWQNDMAAIGQPVDWLGINYYTRKILASDESDQFPGYTPVDGPLPKTSMGWEIYPEGLEFFLNWVTDNYTLDVPIYITENGMSADDPLKAGGVQDSERSAYFDSHLKATLNAISNGVPVKGYFAWSLLDNFEWALGYEKRFGIVHVDFDTLERTPKQSYRDLRAMLTDR